MNPEKIFFGFFTVLALTLNFGFILGDIENPDHHHVYELFAAIVVNLIATVLKFGAREQLGSILLASSLVAVLHLLAAAMVWAWVEPISGGVLSASDMAAVVSLAAGAVLANAISVILLIIDTVRYRR